MRSHVLEATLLSYLTVALGCCLVSPRLSFLINDLAELELMTFRLLQSPEVYSSKEICMLCLFVCLTLHVFLRAFPQSDSISLCGKSDPELDYSFDPTCWTRRKQSLWLQQLEEEKALLEWLWCFNITHFYLRLNHTACAWEFQGSFISSNSYSH